MIEQLLFLAAPDGIERAAFQAEIVAVCAAREGSGRLVVNQVVAPPEALPYRSPTDPSIGSNAPPPYAAIVEVQGEAPRLCNALADIAGACHAYHVRSTLRFDRGEPLGKGEAPGIRLIGQLMFHADMPDAAVQRSWALHSALAARVHVGATHYVQHWVEQCLEHAPPARGMPAMYFPSMEALLERFFDSERGAQEIYHDTAHFVASGPRFYTRPWIVRTD